MRLGKRAFSVLSLRPGTPHRFATNRFHDTWHILCNAGSAHYLARLLWALSFDNRPNTILVIDGASLVANPFDADPSLAFAFVNRDTTSLDGATARDLARRLPLGTGHQPTSSDGTVVMRSDSRPAALQEALNRPHDDNWWHKPRRNPTTRRVANLITFSLAAPDLRELSLQTDFFDDMKISGAAVFFAEYGKGYSPSFPEGEIQNVADFDLKVARARRRRTALFPGRDDELLTVEERIQVW